MSWEQRMAERAAARKAAEPPEPARGWEHDGHHTHMRGSLLTCSCGAYCGICTIVVDLDNLVDPDTLTCWICGEQGVVGPPRA